MGNINTDEYSSLYANDTENLKKLDLEFKKIVKRDTMEEWFIPALIESDVLERCGYFSTMPNQLTKVSVINREKIEDLIKKKSLPRISDYDNSPNYFLTPAACLHLYPMIEKHPIKNKIITTFARVYRYEEGKFEKKTRQWDFSVREFVAVGTPKFVEDFLEDMMNSLLNYAQKIYDHVYIEEASDHFYPSKNNLIKKKFQLKNSLKKELVAEYDNKKISLASFNYHTNHFSKEFNFDEDGTIVSGCVGCGLERWLKLIEVRESGGKPAWEE
ncbi:aminoacyl--tRNA ligase-related protein [Pseudolactococcus reticulitermitis]|uniref:Aminoacyl-tRNA synthetase class II (G/ P/ S/T) domain-containing protein n=1 Tax=Pseudolactococcus reticulitermitis TaxID=2025039 RepID=A0A224WXB3_9LACT|nr:aminoacyl--tRNA ligase-related protein [Lactococcus reticulitermitis]GAX46877.1 hypothetical protein RsY01_457 [Lactococcus reticulitermitis]